MTWWGRGSIKWQLHTLSTTFHSHPQTVSMRSDVKSSDPCHQISAFISPQALRLHRRTPSPPSTRPVSPWSGRHPGTPEAEATSPTACTAENAPATAGSACRAAAASTLCPDSMASRRLWCWSQTCSQTLTTASLSRARTECRTWVLHPGARSLLTSPHHRQVRAFRIHTSSYAFRVLITISSWILRSNIAVTVAMRPSICSRYL